jgi:hypothetical protein
MSHSESEAQVMDKRRAGSQTSGWCSVGGVRHTVGKLLKRATSLLENSSQSEV